jgi:HAD superfamily hydrolase (TIGR01509 family)
VSYDAILFDFDGVLVDSEPVHHQVWTEVLTPYGIELPWDVYQARCIGVSDKAMIRELCEISGRPEVFEELWNEYPRKKAIFRERMVADPPMPAATIELLAGLAAERRLALVTSSGRTEVQPVLERTGVHGHFSAFVFGEDVARLKPDPEPYQKAAALLGARRPLVVEDSEAGVASGRAAGFDVVRIPDAYQTSGLVNGWLAGVGS